MNQKYTEPNPFDLPILTLDGLARVLAEYHANLPDRIGPWFIDTDGYLQNDGSEPPLDGTTWEAHREAIRALGRHPRARFKVLSDGLILVGEPQQISFRVEPARPVVTLGDALVAHGGIREGLAAIPTLAEMVNAPHPKPAALRLFEPPPPPPPTLTAVGPSSNRRARRRAAALARRAK